MASTSYNFAWGNPTPGPQTPNPDAVMDHVFFLSNSEWKTIREACTYDYVVIGSGFCGYAFAQRVLENSDFNAKVLLIERGPFFLPDHFQNLAPAYTRLLGGLSETFPWTLTRNTLKEGNIFQHGMIPFVGGRSIMWSAWCPEPFDSEIKFFPKEVQEELKKQYFASAKKLLNVRTSDQIGEQQEQITKHMTTFHSASVAAAGPTAAVAHEKTIQSTSALEHNKNKDISVAQKQKVVGVFYGDLQKNIKLAFDSLWPKDDLKKGELSRVQFAPMAVGSPEDATFDFYKYSVPEKLIDLVSLSKELRPAKPKKVETTQAGVTEEEKHLEAAKAAIELKERTKAPLWVVTNCVVEKIVNEQAAGGNTNTRVATALQTSRGVVNLGNAKVILAMGSLPPATLVQNSFSPETVPNVGTRFTAHVISSIKARVSPNVLDANILKILGHAQIPKVEGTQIGAIYLDRQISKQDGSKDEQLHFHIQMSIFCVPQDRIDKDINRVLRYTPDTIAGVSKKDLQDANGKVVFVCAVLVELERDGSYFKQNIEAPHSTNSTLHMNVNGETKGAWEKANKATFKLLCDLCGPTVEFFKPTEPLATEGKRGSGEGEWTAVHKDDFSDIYVQSPDVVHEGSTLFFDHVLGGKKQHGPVEEDYKLKNVENVYVTGAGLWPAGGSFNPTMTMVGMAQHLADNLSLKKEADKKEVDKTGLAPISADINLNAFSGSARQFYGIK